jgi:RNA polymerase sigma-70 factor (ECF subfamily)
MLRITTTHYDRARAHLRVEGRVTGETMGELRSVCEGRLQTRRPLVIDLTGVAYADPAGAKLLRSLELRGASLVGANGFLSELVRRDDCTPTRSEHERCGPVPARRDEGGTLPVDGDERALVERMRRGDEMACELVVRRFAPRLLAVARRILGSEDEAHDALQEAFLSAFRGIDSFTGDSRLSTWLHRIVVNAALMRLRSRKRRAEDSIEDLLPRFADDGHWLEAPSSWRSDELLERHETRATVRRCIERLPARHREVLVLRDIEELDTSEVAETLGITANAVKVRLHRARQALRTLIERDMVARAGAGAGA